MPVQFTTDLPDAAGLTLDASIQSEMTADWDGVLNNGEYRLELRDDDPDGNHPPYELEAEVGFGTTAHTIGGLLDGEQYSIRLRTQTAYATGGWLEAEEITKLVPASDVTLTTTDQSATVTWVDESDFDGSYQLYRRRTDYDYSGLDDPGRLVGTVADTAESYDSGDALAPGREYEYVVRALTQWVHADSESNAAETDSVGLEQHNVPPRGWYVEVDHPSGTTLTPQILDDVQRRPRINDPPLVEIPAPRSETWLSADLDDAPLRVWKDGRQLAVDTLEDREIKPDRVVLHGTVTEGLSNRVTASVDVERADDLARNLIEERTGLVANVDPAEENLQEDVVMLEASTTAELEDALTEELSPDDPVTITGGEIETYDTCWVHEGENADRESSLQFSDGVDSAGSTSGDYSGGDGLYLSAQSDYGEWDFEIDYTVPAGEFNILVRNDITSENVPQSRWLLLDSNGNTVAASDTASYGVTGLEWRDVTNAWGGFDVPELEPGQYTLRFENTTDDPAGYLLDVVAPCDDRFVPAVGDLDNVVHESGGYLDDPPRKPDAIDLEFGDAETIFAVVNGYGDITIDDTGNEQALALSNDRGRTWTEQQNTATISAAFGDVGDTLRLRVTLSNMGTRDTATPRTGYESQTLSAIELRADLDDAPLVIDEVFDGNLADVLAEIAEDSNSIWEVGRDGGALSVEWTQPGQRASSADHDVVDYITRRVASNIQRAVVKGSALEVRDETITAAVGEAVELEELDGEDTIVPGTDRLVDDDGRRYTRGVDYDLDRQAATITALQGGDLEDGVEYSVDYDYKVAGTYETDDYSGDPAEEHVEDVTGLTTARACAQAAKLIVDAGSDPRTEADVSFPPTIPADISLVEALDLVDVPGDAMAIYNLTDSPAGLEARLGNESRVRDTVEQIRRRAVAASRRV